MLRGIWVFGYHDLLPKFCAGGTCGEAGDVYSACTPAESDTCVCDFDTPAQPIQQRYSTSGSSVTISQNDQMLYALSYCVRGDELFVSSGDGDDSFQFQLERSSGQ
jgi:hypothetical protein